ncbi:hypothetical protein [Altererythrobacter sp. C41]|uniref:hypothetical protein n=1 Tax=Altererythrobacter sp. C41 TaxID=2806021 RepID=UPI001931991F|nr:hypothetical protein [Altererythrobacter sp. C41]MBM0169188.1 hypothetical protein [Altererythrobacter sp. C41]
MKACFFRNANTGTASLLAGSGNFSLNGLSRSIECGVTLSTTTPAEYQRHIEPLFHAADALWNAATNLNGLLAQYLQLWTPGSAPRSGQAPSPAQLARGAYQKFWIEVGYVTRNRGGREGNQFDMPRGVHSFFGLQAGANQALNSTIGNVTFVGNGPPLIRALRLGNNSMEKLTLPFPEEYPFGTYSGKILEFTRQPGGFSIDAYELDDFEKLLRQSPRGVTLKMGSGRTYGYRN